MESELQAYVRKNPDQAIAVGVGAGMLLAQLPIRPIISGVLRLALWMLKPALIAYGLFRLAEDCREGRCPWKVADEAD